MQCPFFLQHNELEICCEGIMDRCMHKITFRRRGDKALFLGTYCEKHYQKCEYYRMLMCEKYEEEYKDK